MSTRTATPVRAPPSESREARFVRPAQLRAACDAPAAAMAHVAAAAPCTGLRQQWGQASSGSAPQPLRAAAPRQAARPVACGSAPRGACEPASAPASRALRTAATRAALPQRPLPLAPRRRSAARRHAASYHAAAAAAAGDAGDAAPKAAAAPPAVSTSGARRLLSSLDGLWGKLLPMSALFFFMAFANSVLDRCARPSPPRAPRTQRLRFGRAIQAARALH